jgi:hypothetical protein
LRAFCRSITIHEVVILRLSKLLVVPLFAPLVACTGTVDASNSPDADSSEVAAAIAIDTTSYADEAAPAHTTAVARFIRARSSVDDATMHMLGAALDLPPVGTCSGISTHVENAGQAVELVDVGAIDVDIAGQNLSLTPRHLPDMDDLVWGVVYSARADGTESAVSGPTSPRAGFPSVALRVAGSKDVGAFSIDVANVEAPANVTFDGDALAPILLRGNEDLHASWTPIPQSADVIYFEVDNGTETLVCAYDDRGSADLPASLFATRSGSLTIHRLHRELVTAHGIDDGEARFDFARVYDFVSP